MKRLLARCDYVIAILFLLMGTTAKTYAAPGVTAATSTPPVSPVVNSITATTPSNTNPTNATSVTYTITFSEDVTGVDASDFTISTLSGNATGSGIIVSPVSASVYTATINGVAGNGTFRLDLNASGTGIQDLASDPISGGFTAGDVYTIDNTIPTLTSGSYFSNNGFSSQYAKVGDNITLSVGYNEVLQSAIMTIGGNPVSITFSNGNRNFTGVYTTTAGDTEGNVPWTLSATDLAGNVRNYSNNDFGTVLIFDKTPPAVAIGAPSAPVIGTGSSGTITYAVNYVDANFNFSTLDLSGITLNTTGTANGTLALSGSGSSYTVTISNVTGLGTLGISVGAGFAQDIPGNIDATGGGPSTTVNVVPVDDSLTNLTVNANPLTPSFTPGDTTYTRNIVNGAQTVTIVATADDPLATILVNGTPVASGVGSNPIPVAVGVDTVTVKVTAEDLVTTKTYTLILTRAGARNALLKALSLSHGALSPVFTGTNGNYTASVVNGVTTTNVTPTLADPNATILLNGITPIASGAASADIPLVVGPNTITLAVTAQNDTAAKTYTIVVTRAAASNAHLSAFAISRGTLSPGFTGANTSYTASVVNGVTSMTVKPTVSDPLATVTVNGISVTSGAASGPITLNVGSNIITTVVTAQDNSTKTYTLTVTRALDVNAYLSAFAISRGTLTPVFNAGTTSYRASVANGVPSMTVTLTTADTNATVTVNGTAVASGTASGPITLAPGLNTITTVVTAQDGVTKKTYTVVVTEAKSSNNNLAHLSPGTGSISPAFSSATTVYTESVANSVSSITITPTSVVNTATIKVRGTAVASGTASAPIALSVGANTINTIVTAQDGTTKTYTLTVTRATGGADSFDPGISVAKPVETVTLAEDGIQVHQGVSPNGDGMNDFLQIDNISQHPDNKLSIMNRNGQLIFEASGYDNSSKIFDGHSNKNGQMQLPGTYFYQLDYTVKGITKHKTGFIVLKY